MAKEIKYLDLEGLKALYGVVDTKVASAVSGLKGTVTKDFDTLGKIEGKITDITKEKGLLETAVKNAVNNLVGTAPDTLDTLGEIAAYITSDETGAVKLAGTVAANTAAIEKLNDADTVEGSVKHSVKTVVDGLNATVGSTTVADGKHVAVEVKEEKGKLTDIIITESDIASATALADEIARAQGAEKANADAIAAINNTTTGILAAAKTYTDGEFTKRTTLANYNITDATVNETAQTVSLGGNTLQFVALTAAEIQSAVNA